MSDLLSALTTHSQGVVHTIDTFLQEKETEAQEIDRYLARSVQLLRTFSLRGGKAIRPFVAQVAYDLAGGEKHPGLLKALSSIELHHKHILILDDIADRDEKRYGGPTLEYAYREEMEAFDDSDHKALSFAMMDSVLLASYSKELIQSSGFTPKQILACLHIFNTIMYRDVLAGWQIHGMQCTEKLADSTQAEFIKGLRLVTASYTFEGPFMIGLTLASNTDQILTQALRTYADNVGTAFQIHDDVLGLYGDSEKTGKPVGNDVREGKKTLLLQVAYERGSAEEKALLEKSCGQPISTDMLREIQRIVTVTGSLDYSKQLEKDYVQTGLAALDVLPTSKSKNLLIELAHYIITRDK